MGRDINVTGGRRSKYWACVRGEERGFSGIFAERKWKVTTAEGAINTLFIGGDFSDGVGKIRDKLLVVEIEISWTINLRQDWFG